MKNDDEVKSVSNEMTVSEDLVAFEEISAAVDTMAAKVGRRLRKKGTGRAYPRAEDEIFRQNLVRRRPAPNATDRKITNSYLFPFSTV